MKEPSITVAFRPFTLALRRTNAAGEFVATLSLTGAPTALVHSTASTHAGVRTDTPTPCLQIGTAQFAVPTRQLARIGEWLVAQHAPVDLSTALASEAGAEPREQVAEPWREPTATPTPTPTY
ncbi:hypothetical protein [Luteimonas sp. FCS-9]|uniref:hypothetical protein n=1 Tax=Luteimonas sp. FCS-9 TaxID=1547516 RepID=UPI00063EB57F|nr:hypothetical protein [Luteimonas sp. FCS-9]KLJ02855.1 hypothetical protein WQ56_00815 [Luteimonas sp. FCS-9]